ncbi:MAG: AAC(3) family N-acetyltransferase [Akkermansiaceae bacterium]|nr:AAC(3) family N-acetyltransferase [Akkermansiaceae bacterium]
MGKINAITNKQVFDCLDSLLVEGDDVFVHSSLSGVGDLEDGAEGIIESMLDIVSPNEGTLVFPTATTTFAKTGFFDVSLTPSETGAMTELFRLKYAQKRSCVPMYSFAATGKNYLDYTSVYDGFLEEYSPLLSLIKNRGKILLFGVDYNKCSIYHLSEERKMVDYNFYKTFSGIVVDEQGESREGSQRYYVRKRLNTIKEVNWVGGILESRGKVQVGRLGAKVIKSFLAKDFDDLCMEVLSDNAKAFIKCSEG